jgi:hypothetical protein
MSFAESDWLDGNVAEHVLIQHFRNEVEVKRWSRLTSDSVNTDLMC